MDETTKEVLRSNTDEKLVVRLDDLLLPYKKDADWRSGEDGGVE